MSFAEQLKSVRLRSTTRPKEKINEQLLCPDSDTYRQMMIDTQFEHYYDSIKQWTFPSVILPMTDEDLKALCQGHELFKTSSLENDDRKTEECLRIYPQLSNLCRAIDTSGIKSPLFVRLSTRSPKDAALLLNKEKFKHLFRQILDQMPPDGTSESNRRLIALDEASIRLLAVDDGFHAVQLLLASERIQDDLGSSSSQLNLIVRQFIVTNRRLENEFRAFIFERRLTALTQYNEFIFYPRMFANKNVILKSILEFFEHEHILEQIPFHNCTLDLVLIENENIYQIFICEINPLAEFAGTGLFSWLNDRDILLGRQSFEFRVREKENQGGTEANNHWLTLIDEN